jgi:exopolysaccharide biosynthesis WecB/TagA/CpsF family protein
MDTDTGSFRSIPIGRALNPAEPDSVRFELDDYDLPGFLSVAERFGSQKYGYVATPNVDGLIRVRESASFRAEYARAAYVLLDSRVAAFFFRLVYRVRVPVCPGSDLTTALLHKVIKPDDRVLLIGSTEEQAQTLRQRFGLKHLLHHNPPMGFIRDPAAVETCLQFMESASPFRYCLIAVGDPQGVIIAHQLAVREQARGLAFVIGASIDFVTGKQKRAPSWMQRIGFEWLFRLSRDPRRLAWRYLVRGPKFFVYLATSRAVLRPARPHAE